jgi:hypothetical protein
MVNLWHENHTYNASHHIASRRTRSENTRVCTKYTYSHSGHLRHWCSTSPHLKKCRELTVVLVRYFRCVCMCRLCVVIRCVCLLSLRLLLFYKPPRRNVWRKWWYRKVSAGQNKTRDRKQTQPTQPPKRQVTTTLQAHSIATRTQHETREQAGAKVVKSAGAA